MMRAHSDLLPGKLGPLIRGGEIAWGGNRALAIYGTLTCASGRRMKRKNRVFFTSLAEAESLGYRPCGHCQRAQFSAWKAIRYPAESPQESDRKAR